MKFHGWLVVVWAHLVRAEFKIGAPILVTNHHHQPLSTAGYDERFANDYADDPKVMARIRRFMDIQEKVRALENPGLAIETRATMARDWLSIHRIVAPRLTLQLWEDWNEEENRDDDAE
jgi:hypothetical protein